MTFLYLRTQYPLNILFSKDPFDNDEEIEEVAPDENGTIVLTPGKNAKIPLGGMGKGQKIRIKQPDEIAAEQGMPPPPKPDPPKPPPEPVAEWSDKPNMKVKLVKEDQDETCNKLDEVRWYLKLQYSTLLLLVTHREMLYIQ